MPAHDPIQRIYVSQIAAGRRWGADTTEARQALKVSRAEDYIRRLVAEAPAISDSQRQKLALLLRGPSQSGGAAA